MLYKYVLISIFQTTLFVVFSYLFIDYAMLFAILIYVSNSIVWHIYFSRKRKKAIDEFINRINENL